MKKIRYARTFNLGNFESERVEIEEDFPIDKPDHECLAELRKRINNALAASKTLPT